MQRRSEDSTMQCRHALSAVLASLLLLAAAPAGAQATRTWVSGVGDDANPCSRTAPCKTFPGAISKTAAGGEINVLDPGGFGGVTITKSITIRSDSFTAGVLVSGTNAIIVNAGANDIVILKGLDIEGLGTGLNGVRFLAGGALHVEDCTINNFTQSGIHFNPSGASKLFVTNTIIRRSNPLGGISSGGIFVFPAGAGSAQVALDNVQLLNNFHGLRTQGNVRVTARECVSSGNVSSGFLVGFSSQVDLDGCVASSNAKGLRSEGAGAVARIANTSIVENTVEGLATASGGVIQSFGNNHVAGNGTNGAPTSTIGEM
jgi:hypothetical protein